MSCWTREGDENGYSRDSPVFVFGKESLPFVDANIWFVCLLVCLQEVDGGMTSDTAKQSWGVSSDKSEFDSRNNSVHSMTKPCNPLDIPSTPERVAQDMNRKEEERKRRENKYMLFASGMMGVKRQTLGKLRCVCSFGGI